MNHYESTLTILAIDENSGLGWFLNVQAHLFIAVVFGQEIITMRLPLRASFQYRSMHASAHALLTPDSLISFCLGSGCCTKRKDTGPLSADQGQSVPCHRSW
jgi:hypothetical protein